MMRTNRMVFILLSALLLLLALTGLASAHAVVYPNKAAANSYEKFALRVPTEKDIPTVKVKVEIPDGFAVSRVQPVPGWKYEFEKNGAGTVTAITWSGGEIAATEFQEFIFQGKTPKDAGKFAFRAYQTYKDGSVVEWTGPSDAKTPASVVEVTAAVAQTDEHGEAKPAATPPAQPAPASKPAEAAQPVSSTASQSTNSTTPVVAWAGVVLGALAVLLSFRRRGA